MAAIARLKVKTECELYDYMRKVHGASIPREGNTHYFWQGPAMASKRKLAAKTKPLSWTSTCSRYTRK